MALSNPGSFTRIKGLRDHHKSRPIVTKRRPRYPSATARNPSMLPQPSVYTTTVATKPAIEHTKLDQSRTTDRTNAIHLGKTAESHQSVARCMREVSATAYELVAKSYQALVAIYDTIMTLAELTIGTSKLLWTVGCLMFATGKWLYATGLSFWEKIMA